MRQAPHIVGIGGTPRVGSTSELALRHALDCVRDLGGTTDIIAGPALALPHFDPSEPHRPPAALRLIQSIRDADGIVIASPAYHGTISGLIKNALDYVEDTGDDAQPYFDGRAVGLIVCADGVQSLGTTLTALRSIVHTLRGWPTPYAAAINPRDEHFAEIGVRSAAIPLATVAGQVVDFARAMRPSGSGKEVETCRKEMVTA